MEKSFWDEPYNWDVEKNGLYIQYVKKNKQEFDAAVKRVLEKAKEKNTSKKKKK